MTRTILGLVVCCLSWPCQAQSTAVPQTDVSRKAGTLSQKLSDTDGIIQPQGSIDPGIQKDAPAMGTMPVIPPPGSPGGATGVQPK